MALYQYFNGQLAVEPLATSFNFKWMQIAARAWTNIVHLLAPSRPDVLRSTCYDLLV